jgi:hypothetical protein
MDTLNNPIARREKPEAIIRNPDTHYSFQILFSEYSGFPRFWDYLRSCMQVFFAQFELRPLDIFAEKQMAQEVNGQRPNFQALMRKHPIRSGRADSE